MSTTSATVTAGQTYVADGSGNIQLTLATLNALGIPVVTMTLDGVVTSTDLNAALSNLIPRAAFTIGAEASDAISVAIQIQNTQSTAITEFFGFRAWLSDTAYAGETATSPSTGFTVTTGTQLQIITAKEHLYVETDTDGVAVLKIDHAGGGASHTWYLNVVMGSRVYVSGAITITI